MTVPYCTNAAGTRNFRIETALVLAFVCDAGGI